MVGIGVIVLSLFLPYETHDYYSGVSSQSATFQYIGTKTLGINHVGAYIPIVIIAMCMGMINIKENLATAIISMILSFFNLLYMAFLGFILTFHLNFFGGGPINFELEGGYFLSVLVGFYFLTIMISHLLVVVRKRRNPAKYNVKPVSSELLNDVI